MAIYLKNARVYNNGKFSVGDLIVDGGSIVSASQIDMDSCSHFEVFTNCYIFPGFCDVHVHFREPGFSYKETIATGSAAAAAGGYTAVCTMPNLSPVPDSAQTLKEQLDIIKRDAVISVTPYGSITKLEAGIELSDMEEMAENVAGYSDDGRGVQSEELMLLAMQKAKKLGLPIVAHCEDNSLLRGGYIHDGEYAKAHGHRGICSESEWLPIARDIELVKQSGCSYHVCHISTKESVELIRRAKRDGVDITCETAPHYLVMNDMDIEEHGRFKMNPPIRSEEDRLALVEGLLDGTIDMISTDHAPHSKEEKSRGLSGSLMGVVGIETAFCVMYTYLVREGIITLERLMELLSTNARERFSIKSDVGFSVWQLDKEHTVDPEKFISKGRSTPFENARLYGKNLMTVFGGKVVYSAIEKA